MGKPSLLLPCRTKRRKSSLSGLPNTVLLNECFTPTIISYDESVLTTETDKGLLESPLLRVPWLQRSRKQQTRYRWYHHHSVERADTQIFKAGDYPRPTGTRIDLWRATVHHSYQWYRNGQPICR